MITELDKESRKAGLKLNLQATKVIYNNLGREQCFDIGISALGVVKDYVYLEQVITAEPNHETEVTIEE